MRQIWPPKISLFLTLSPSFSTPISHLAFGESSHVCRSVLIYLLNFVLKLVVILEIITKKACKKISLLVFCGTYDINQSFINAVQQNIETFSLDDPYQYRVSVVVIEP